MPQSPWPADAEAFRHLPVLPLGAFPTPVLKLERPDGFSFWVKDDGRTGTPYGGNKVRKFEYLLAEARWLGIRKLIAGGDTESHTVRACAALGRLAGFSVEAVVYPHGTPPLSSDAIAFLLSTGTRVYRVRSFLQCLLLARFRALLTGGMLIPLGGSSPLSTAGYVRAALELHRQVQAGLLPEPDRLYVAFASGGTAAGLLIGLALAGMRTKVVAVQAVEGVIANRRNLRRLAARTLKRLGLAGVGIDAVMERLERIDDTALGRGYRDVSSGAREAMVEMAGQPLALDPAFTAKAFAAMRQDRARGYRGTTLFWNTHSQETPAMPGQGGSG